MIFLKDLLILVCVGAFVGAVGTIAFDIFLAFELDRILRRSDRREEPSAAGVEAKAPPVGATAAFAQFAPSERVRPVPRRAIRWNAVAKLVAIAAISGLAGASILVVPDGEAAVRISQISGVRPGTLYAGTHLIFPLFDRVQLYDVKDRVFSTAAVERGKEKLEVLTVEAREGLTLGLAITVRYRIDPRRLDYIQANLPQPVDEQVVEPVVTSVFRELAPNYVVRDVFSTKREEFRERAAQQITQRLASDAIVVKEVLLRKVDLPEEYAKGLQGLLLKEQEDDQTSVDADIELKRVKIAEAQAEAAKIREVKRAEGDAQSRVIQAKAESDAMQYTLPLKQKQIEQSRLEAQARKEATIQNAEAEAQAKVIDGKAEGERRGLMAEADAQAKVVDSKAEQQRRNLLADADANQIRVTARAHAGELELEAAALKSNPLLVQYTVAQKLSDKVQIMLVPSDGKFFFTNDVLRSATAAESGDEGLLSAPAKAAPGKK
jgi:regulator of protease activity HflC (stomatin/prohibitin superfamily)